MGRTPLPYDALAAVLRYPDGGYAERVRECAAALRGLCQEAHAEVEAFAGEIRLLSPEEIEEQFTRTFDLNPACCLDLGWHLYGEAYERGRFLVKIRGLLRRHAIVESGELPDHLAHMLPLVGRMAPGPAVELVREAIAPALATMCTALEKTSSPFRHLLAAARSLVNEAPIERAAEVCDA